MPFIRTVRGDIDPVSLGVCYPHEHVLCSPPPDVADRDLEMDSEAAAIQELTWFKQAGGCALVDMTPADYGRSARGMKRVSEATGVHLIATTGLHKDKFSARIVQEKSVDDPLLLICIYIQLPHSDVVSTLNHPHSRQNRPPTSRGQASTELKF